MTKSDLATIRRVLLEVIDDGDLNEVRLDGKKGAPWEFYRDGLLDPNQQRLDFCDRVAELLAREIGV